MCKKDLMLKKEFFEEQLNSLNKLVCNTENTVDNAIYNNLSNTLLKYNKIIEKNILYTCTISNFLQQYVDLSSRLILKYNKDKKENINSINSFINTYVNENLDYKYYIFKEFENIGLVEERIKLSDYYVNSLKKILQIFSVTYRKDNESLPRALYDSSIIGSIQNKAKIIVKYIIDLNKKSLLINQVHVIKPTNTVMEIVCNLPDFIVDNEENFKELTSWLYKIFWDNNQKIREYALSEELDFVNSLRTYYYHDIDHGEKSKIRQKFRKVKNIFYDSCGKIIPENAKDWQKIQEAIYDRLISFLESITIAEKNDS